jgi:16S rRNA G966 N2-methylase RsmD
MPRYPAQIAFLDPPYSLDEEYRAVLELLAQAPPLIAVLQHSVRTALPEEQAPLVRTRVVKQGDNALSFYAASVP